MHVLIENRKNSFMSSPNRDNINIFENLRIDLHSHTTFSDGKLSPKELIDRAVNFQLDVLAITDHDSVAALPAAQQYIEKENLPITLLNGIEISTSWHGFDIHIVGLNINPEHPKLVELITEQQQAREERAIIIGEKLAKAGFNDIYQQAKKLAGSGTITRAHFAQVLLQQGKITKLQQAFDKYLGKGKRAFVKPKWCEINHAVDVIKQAGGVAVLAHPIRYDLSGKWRRKLIIEFKAAGGSALEIVLPQMSPDQKRLMLSYCQEYDLHASLGSDFHYPSRWSDLGRNLHLPENCQPVWQLF